jgi:hypothetical protein
MSGLQTAVRPYLVPMLKGEQTKLFRNGQTTLGAWVAMMVMVAEHLDNEMVAIPQTDRDWLRSNLKPPSHWRIWIGRHEARSHPSFTHNVVSFVPEKEIERLGPEGAVPPNTQTSTILLGKHLLIHVMSSHVARKIIRNWKLPALAAPSLAQIWRHEATVRWPVPEGQIFRDSDINFLAQEFITKGNALAREVAFSRGF